MQYYHLVLNIICVMEYLIKPIFAYKCDEKF